MRTPAAVLAAVVALAACGGEGGSPPSPRPPPSRGGDVPRPEVELLVRRFSPAGARSFYTMAPDGSGVAPLPGLPGDTLDAVPSPDGRTLALVREAGFDVHLWLMDRWTGALAPVLEGFRVVHSVAWSPDGARLLVAQSTLEAEEDVFVMARDGSGARNLTPDARPAIAYERDPAWSPDGRTIAFTSSKTGGSRLWLSAPDGSDARVLLAGAEQRERDPAWSPDGEWLAFLAEVPDGHGGADFGIGIARPDGTGYRVFLQDGFTLGPAWSPDGRIVFASDARWDWNLRALDPATGEVEDLTGDLGHDVEAHPIRWAEPPAWAGLAVEAAIDAGARAPVAIGAGDLDGDGWLDVLALSAEPVGARLLRGTAGGLVSLGGLEAPRGARALALEDVTGDGISDAVLLGEGALRVFRGSAQGTGVPTDHALGGEGLGIAALDFGQDRGVEVGAVVARGPEEAFRAQLHGTNGEGTFVPLLDGAVPYAGPVAATAGDATGDGLPDLVALLEGGAASVVILPGMGPSFEAPVEAAAGLAFERGDVPVLADLDGDRRGDLAVLRPGGGLTVLRWKGEVLVGEPLPSAVGTDLAAADLDRDGDLDLAVADPDAGAVSFVRNRGDGTFAPPLAWPVAGRPSRLVAADLDGDRWVDVAVAGEDGRVHVLRNLGR